MLYAQEFPPLAILDVAMNLFFHLPTSLKQPALCLYMYVSRSRAVLWSTLACARLNADNWGVSDSQLCSVLMCQMVHLGVQGRCYKDASVSFVCMCGCNDAMIEQSMLSPHKPSNHYTTCTEYIRTCMDGGDYSHILATMAGMWSVFSHTFRKVH